MARLAKPVDLFLVEPDKLDIQTLTWFSINHALLVDLMVKRQQHKWKADAVLFELADVVNAL